MPTIVFNSSTGSDVTASGSQGAVVASGSNASFSGSTVTLDGSPDLSGFDAAEDVLFLDTTSGRKVFDLSGADDGLDTVTTVDAPAGTSTGLTWAIGGKRATLDNADSRSLGADVKAGWVVEIETNQSLTSTFTFSTAGTDAAPVTVRGSGAVPVITQTADAANFTLGADGYRVRGLEFHNSNGTKTSAHGVAMSVNATLAWHLFSDCVFGDPAGTDNLLTGISRTGGQQNVDAYNCRFVNCTDDGVLVSGTSATVRATLCRFEDLGGNGIDTGGSSVSARVMATDCVFTGCAGDGIVCSVSSSGPNVRGCVFEGCADGIDVSGSDNNSVGLMIVGNVFAGNTVAIRGRANTDAAKTANDWNAFFNNGTDLVSVTGGDNDIALSADPFVDAAGHDFNLNATAGGGADLRAAAIPVTASTGLYPFRHLTAADFGGGGAFVGQGLHAIESGI